MVEITSDKDSCWIVTLDCDHLRPRSFCRHYVLLTLPTTGTNPLPKFFRIDRCSMGKLRYELHIAQTSEEIEKTVVCRLIIKESHLATLTHIRHDFDRAPKVSVGVPGRCKNFDVRFPS